MVAHSEFSDLLLLISHPALKNTHNTELLLSNVAKMSYHHHRSRLWQPTELEHVNARRELSGLPRLYELPNRVKSESSKTLNHEIKSETLATKTISLGTSKTLDHLPRRRNPDSTEIGEPVTDPQDVTPPPRDRRKKRLATPDRAYRGRIDRNAPPIISPIASRVGRRHWAGPTLDPSPAIEEADEDEDDEMQEPEVEEDKESEVPRPPRKPRNKKKRLGRTARRRRRRLATPDKAYHP